MDEDEAYVETEEDPLVPDTEPESQPPPQMPNLWILWFKHYLSNPWVLIILFLFFYFYVFKKFWPKIQFFFQNHWNDWRAKNEEAKVIADMKKNPDLYRQKIEAMDAIRRRQQETYEAAARLLAEKQALLSIKPILCFVILFRRHRVSASKFFLLFRKSTKFFTMSANQSSTQPGARGMEATDPSQGAAAQPPHIPSQSVIQSPVEPGTVEWGWWIDELLQRETARRVQLEEEVAELRRRLEIFEIEAEIRRLCDRLDDLNRVPALDEEVGDDDADQAYTA